MAICKLYVYRSGWALCRKVDVQGSLADDDRYQSKRYDDEPRRGVGQRQGRNWCCIGVQWLLMCR
jgi:hypothetical protein